jgi:6-phosphogluconolactonase
MKLLELNKTEDIARTGAKLIADRLCDMDKSADSIVMGLAGGRSVRGIYRTLAETEMPAWKKVHFFWVDERRVPLNDIHSNYRLANELLLRPLLGKGIISAENIHPLKTEGDPEIAAKQYTMELNAIGNGFDIVLLGAGEDGHIAAIFPEIIYTQIREFTFIDQAPKPPPQRFTASPALLANSRTVFLVYSGASKKAALRHFLDESPEMLSEKSLPERTLREIADLNILTDQKV